MTNYIILFFGLLVFITVPEDASLLHFTIQSLIGGFIFGIGSFLIIDEDNNK